eukprot:10551986-Lingulodinium_polyedra.AAC.1
MDVERKRNLDKRLQHRTVNLFSKASRDAVLRSWRLSGLRLARPAVPEARVRKAFAERKCHPSIRVSRRWL